MFKCRLLIKETIPLLNKGVSHMVRIDALSKDGKIYGCDRSYIEGTWVDLDWFKKADLITMMDAVKDCFEDGTEFVKLNTEGFKHIHEEFIEVSDEA